MSTLILIEVIKHPSDFFAHLRDLVRHFQDAKCFFYFFNIVIPLPKLIRFDIFNQFIS